MVFRRPWRIKVGIEPQNSNKSNLNVKSFNVVRTPILLEHEIPNGLPEVDSAMHSPCLLNRGSEVLPYADVVQSLHEILGKRRDRHHNQWVEEVRIKRLDSKCGVSNLEQTVIKMITPR